MCGMEADLHLATSALEWKCQQEGRKPTSEEYQAEMKRVFDAYVNYGVARDMAIINYHQAMRETDQTVRNVWRWGALIFLVVAGAIFAMVVAG